MSEILLIGGKTTEESKEAFKDNLLRKNKTNRAGFLVKCGLLAFLAVFAAFSLLARDVEAQQPSPTVTVTPAPTDGDSKFTEYLNEITIQSIAFKDSLAETFEQPLTGWFLQIANYMGFLVFGFFMLRKVLKGEMNFEELKKQGVIFTFCLLGLIWCGDVNGDGKSGDLVNKLQGLGSSIAYGYSPATPQGNYLGGLVNQQRIKFDENYAKFVENKLMVKIDAAEMPIRYPGMRGVQTIAALYTGRPLTDNEKKDAASAAFRMSIFSQFLGFCRWIVEGIDFILFFIVFLTVMAVRLFLPFAFAVVSDDGLAKRITFPFLWSTFTITVICPLIAQICRLLIFVCGNIGLGSSSSNPNFSFDAAHGTIVGSGHPEWTIAIAGFTMLLAIVFLGFSLLISYKLMQGALVEAVTGLATQMFGMAASTGIGMGVNYVSNNLNRQADGLVADETLRSQQVGADYNEKVQNVAAETALESNKIRTGTALKSDEVTAVGTANAARQSAYGSMVNGMRNVNAEHYEKAASSLADLNQNWETMNSEQKRDSSMNALDTLSKNNDLYTREGQQRIRDEVEKLNLPGDQLNQALGMIPVVGSVLKTVGVNGEALNPLLRTTAGQAVLGSMLSAATNGGIPTPLGTTMMQSLDTSGGIPLLTQAPPDSGLGKYTPDGARFDSSQLFSPDNVQPANSPPAQTTTAPSANAPKNAAKPLVLAKPASNSSSLPAPQMSRTQRSNLAALQRISKDDPQFIPTLQRESRKRGIDPNNMLNMLAIESSFRKDVLNPSGYLGLGQVGSAERQSLGKFGWTGNNAVDRKRVEAMSPSQQLESLVFPFVDKKFNNPKSGLTMDKLYAGWGSGHSSNDPNYVHMENGGKRSKAYNANPQWDYNKDGKVQQWEFGASAPSKLGAGVFFDANQASGSLRFYDPVTAKVMAQKFAREYELGRGLENNEFNRTGKENINSSYYDEKRGVLVERYNAARSINDNVAGIKSAAIQENYGWSVKASDTILTASRAGSRIRADGSLKEAQTAFDGAKKGAGLARQGQYETSQIQHDAAIRALNMKALSNGVQQIGGAISHSVSELVERSSRL